MTTTISKLRPSLARLLSTASGPQRCGSQAIQLNLADGAAAFQPKSTWELFRALAVLKICSIDVFVDNSLTIMKACQSVIGIRAFSYLLRPTFYGQFVGGETEAQLAETGSRLNSLGMGLMVCPVQEEDVGEAAADGERYEAKYDENTAYIVDVANNMGRIQVEQEHQLPPNLQCKITAFMSGDIVVSMPLQFGVRKYFVKITLNPEKANGPSSERHLLDERLKQMSR